MIALTTSPGASPLTLREPEHALSNFFFSVCLCVAVVFGFVCLSENCQHWFIVPVFVCGVLIGIDAIEWWRGQIDVFDPKGILGLFGLHFFFLAPLLHTYLESWMWEVDPPPDWRPWLGWMAALNVLGLVVYRFVVSQMARRQRPAPVPRRVWKPRTKVLMTLLVSAIVLGTIFQGLIYAAFGGISGYIAAYERHEADFLGVTWVMMVAGRVPLLAFITVTLYARSRRWEFSWLTLGAMLSAFTVAQLLFGGLRGERSDIIYALFWAVGIVHYCIRPVPKKIIFAGLGFLVVFMYVYSFYKFAGANGMRDFAQDSHLRSAVEENSHFSVAESALGDLGRCDVQAFVLYRISHPDSDYSYAMGRTYLGALGLMIPGPLWRDRPPSKVKEGWDVLFGARAYEREFGTTAFSDHPINTRLFGLAGEAMLNFGPLLVPLSFAVLGFVVGWTRRRIADWRYGDLRLFLAPYLTTICLLILTADSDNLLYYCEMSGVVPFAILFFGSVRQTASSETVPARGRGDLLPASTTCP
ncbi:MAG TPA: hypothetical protein VG055_15845 [Planctomycetaceae bacterium]|jgi:hypothetical protein|nr:hypothetical protein [Planctomycetaceae bacterium]